MRQPLDLARGGGAASGANELLKARAAAFERRRRSMWASRGDYGTTPASGNFCDGIRARAAMNESLSAVVFRPRD